MRKHYFLSLSCSLKCNVIQPLTIMASLSLRYWILQYDIRQTLCIRNARDDAWKVHTFAHLLRKKEDGSLLQNNNILESMFWSKLNYGRSHSSPYVQPEKPDRYDIMGEDPSILTSEFPTVVCRNQCRSELWTTYCNCYECILFLNLLKKFDW